jgi:hypothetical protein
VQETMMSKFTCTKKTFGACVPLLSPRRAFMDNSASINIESNQEPKLEISLNWFNKWHLNWSCDESTWKQLSAKLTSPLSKGIAIVTGVVIGIGATAYVSVQTMNYLNSGPQSNQIDAPAQKR